MQNPTVATLWLWCASALTLQAAPPAMKPYTIELPHHILHFSLPEEMAREMTPMQVEERFDPDEPGILQGGFRQIAGHLYDLKGPFWVGAYGSFRFHFMVQRKMSEYKGNITTIEDLDRYVHWWNAKIDEHASGCIFSHAALNGKPAVQREWNTFGNPNDSEPSDLIIYSLPLDNDMFLDAGFCVMAWEGGRGKERKWKPKAEALRDAIKATVVLESKPTAVR